MKETSYLDENLKIIDMLGRIDLFHHFAAGDIKTFLQLAKLREYEQGEAIIREGEFDCWLYILLKGTLHISKGGKVLGALKRTGDLFGEMGVIDGSPRSATILAATRCLAIGIDGSIIERKLGDSDMRFCYLIYRIFAEILAVRLRDTTVEFMKYRQVVATLQES